MQEQGDNQYMHDHFFLFFLQNFLRFCMAQCAKSGALRKPSRGRPNALGRICVEGVPNVLVGSYPMHKRTSACRTPNNVLNIIISIVHTQAQQ